MYDARMHVDHVQNVMATPHLDSREQFMGTRVNPPNTRLIFPKLSPDQVLLLAHHHGTKPRFQVQPISWYRGGDDVCFVKSFNGFVKKDYYEKWPSLMFMSVLSIFWGVPDVMTSTSRVRIATPLAWDAQGWGPLTLEYSLVVLLFLYIVWYGWHIWGHAWGQAKEGQDDFDETYC